MDNLDTLSLDQLFDILNRRKYHSDMIWAAQKELDRRLTPKDATFLIAKLCHRSDEARFYILNKLAEFDLETFSNILIDALNDSKFYVGELAATKLVEMLDENIATKLHNLLASSEPRLKLMSAFTLIKSGDLTPIDMVLKEFYNDDEKIRRVALSVIIESEINIPDRLIELLKSGNDNVRSNAAFALRKTKDLRAVAPLLALLRNQPETVITSSIRSLTNIEGPRIVPTLIQIFEENPDSFRIKEIILIELSFLSKGFKDSVSAETVIKIYKNSKDIWSKLYVLKILGNIADENSLSFLASVLSDKNEPETLRVKATTSLGYLKAFDILATVLKDDNEVEEVRVEAARSLGFLKGEATFDVLIEALNSKSERVRRNAVRALGFLDDVRAIPILQKVQQYDAGVSRYEDVAGEAIERIKDSSV